MFKYSYKTKFDVLPNSLKMNMFIRQEQSNPSIDGLLRFFLITLENRYNQEQISYITGSNKLNPKFDCNRSLEKECLLECVKQPINTGQSHMV